MGSGNTTLDIFPAKPQLVHIKSGLTPNCLVFLTMWRWGLASSHKHPFVFSKTLLVHFHFGGMDLGVNQNTLKHMMLPNLFIPPQFYCSNASDLFISHIILLNFIEHTFIITFFFKF